MHTCKLVFTQLMERLAADDVSLPCGALRCHHKIKRFTCWDQYLLMAFAQLTFRESLRDIEACLRLQVLQSLSLGFSASDCHGGKALCQRAFWSLSKDTVYALEATAIDLCLSVSRWGPVSLD